MLKIVDFLFDCFNFRVTMTKMRNIPFSKSISNKFNLTLDLKSMRTRYLDVPSRRSSIMASSIFYPHSFKLERFRVATIMNVGIQQ